MAALAVVCCAHFAFPGTLWAASPPPSEVVELQSIPAGELGVERLAGITWSTDAAALIAIDAPAGQSEAVHFDPNGDVVAAGVTLPVTSSPGTLAYDQRRQRLTFVDGEDLVLVGRDQLSQRRPRFTRQDIAPLGLRTPGAAAFDLRTGSWLVLDDGGRRVRAVDLVDGAATTLPLQDAPREGFRALAVNPVDGLVHLARADGQRLYSYDRSGGLRAVLDLRPLGFRDLRAMTFGPTADRTDGAEAMSLYVADSDGRPGGGRVSEVALTATEPSTSAAVTLAAPLVATRDLSRLNPPSPDPAGVAYVPAADRLLVSDSEVDEMAIFRNVNLYQITRTGSLTSTGVTTTFSNEPTGLGFDPATGRLFVSDDDADEIYIIRRGADGRYGTGDDQRSSFDTRAFGNTDAEGVAFDSSSGAVFIVDGVNKEVYRVAPNSNGFDGVPSRGGDDSVTQFDVGAFGALDPEGIDYDASRRSLLVLDDRSRAVYELTLAGALVRTIDIGAANPVTAAGVAVAPASSGVGRSLYVVDRGIDNDSFPDENDGKLYELGYPPGPNDPPNADAGPDKTVSSDASFELDGTGSNDPEGLPLSYAWTQVAGPQAVIRDERSARAQVDGVPGPATLTFRLRVADPAGASDTDEVTVTVSSPK